MFIQGDLQAVFDALYTIGAIDPILHSDWQKINEDMVKNPTVLATAVAQINSCQGDRVALVEKLNTLNKQAIDFVALEVAREFAEFQDRKDLH